MKIKLFTTVLLSCIVNAIIFPSSSKAQNEYFREGFQPNSTFSTSLIAPQYSVGSSSFGTWYGNGAIVTNGGITNNCGGSIPGIGISHIRLRSTVSSPDTANLVTPVLNYGITNLNFIAGRNGRTFTIWYTKDTLATTTNWTLIKAFKPDTCILAPNLFTTVVVNSDSAKRLKIQSKGDTDLDSVWITSKRPIPVPVNFANISATLSNNLTKISWELGFEINTANYEIERSKDGRNYTSIGTVKANHVSKYSWIDATPSTGVLYYRIKATHNDGSVSYSTIVKVNAVKTLSDLSIYPNPITNKQLNLQMSNFSKGNYQMQLVGSNGAVVYSKGLVSEGGFSSYTVQLPNNVHAGIYQLLVTDGTNRTVKTIDIQ